MKLKWVAGLVLLSALPVFGVAPMDADQILQKAEHIRIPDKAYAMPVSLEDRNGTDVEKRTYDVLVKDKNRTLVKFLTPEIDRGTKVLMVGNEMWVYVPSTAKPLKVPARQKLTGNAVYGDITRLSFVDNYSAKILRDDQFEKKKCVVLELNAIEGKAVTYDRIEYWVEKSSHRPLKAVYMTASGKSLKEARFEKYGDVFGVQRPSEFEISDFLKKDHVTRLFFGKAVTKAMPDLLFEKQNLGRD